MEELTGFHKCLAQDTWAELEEEGGKQDVHWGAHLAGSGTRFGRAIAAKTCHLMGHSAKAGGEVEREGAGWIVAPPGADPGGPQGARE